jgi:hypothetical protein
MPPGAHPAGGRTSTDARSSTATVTRSTSSLPAAAKASREARGFLRVGTHVVRSPSTSMMRNLVRCCARSHQCEPMSPRADEVPPRAPLDRRSAPDSCRSPVERPGPWPSLALTPRCCRRRRRCRRSPTAVRHRRGGARRTRRPRVPSRSASRHPPPRPRSCAGPDRLQRCAPSLCGNRLHHRNQAMTARQADRQARCHRGVRCGPHASAGQYEGLRSGGRGQERKGSRPRPWTGMPCAGSTSCCSAYMHAAARSMWRIKAIDACRIGFKRSRSCVRASGTRARR